MHRYEAVACPIRRQFAASGILKRDDSVIGKHNPIQAHLRSALPINKIH